MRLQYDIIRVMIDRGQEVCVRLFGDFDESARHDLREALSVAANDNIAPRFVVDLQETRFLGSEAIGALLSGCLRAQEAGKWVQIVNAHGVVRTVLQVTGVLELFDAPPGTCREIA
ncbi:STAS domain-containing protein [Actinoplanes sp. N902-109]|uniref:STAS domain-containing protein n=1 Tax=Actinoplanes sp. (strain N902-109) TaxID=649831 RepID=UPI0003293A29|nr:STAS domain-containing protein [Actinoplanes sp. N902-109]AGL17976.1 anti-sigma-factor antagonist [Actinoplanes sp. N902-109]